MDAMTREPLAGPERIAHAVNALEPVYIDGVQIASFRPSSGLRISARRRPRTRGRWIAQPSNEPFLGAREPFQVSGCWPDPIWRVENLEGAHGAHDDRFAAVRFESGTLVGLVPSSSWFGPTGDTIEPLILQTLSLPPRRLRAAATLEAPVVRPFGFDLPTRLPRILRDALRTRLIEKVEAEDPGAGHWEMFGACVILWEWDDQGWRKAEDLTLGAALATLEDDEMSAAGAAAVKRWRSLFDDSPGPGFFDQDPVVGQV